MTGVFSLRTLVLHAMAKRVWGDYAMVSVSNRIMSLRLKDLKQHRLRVVRRIVERFSTALSRLFLSELVQAVVRIQKGYFEALVCLKQLMYEHRVIIPYHLSADNYSVKDFIDPSGHFDDLSWARRYVGSETESVYFRFELACTYCFEEEIRNLWSTSIRRQHYPFYYPTIKSSLNEFVAIWIYTLENRWPDLQFYGGNYPALCNNSLLGYNEHAVRFFWARCSDREKNRVVRYVKRHLRKFKRASYLRLSGFVKLVCSLIPTKRRLKDFIGSHPQMLMCLLLFPGYEPLLEVVKAYPPFDRKRIAVLERLTLEILELPIPEYKRSFVALWTSWSLAEQEEVLRSHLPRLIQFVLETREVDLLKLVVFNLSPDVKRRILLDDWNEAGATALNFLSASDRHEDFIPYLTLLLTDRDPRTKCVTVRENIADIVYKLIQCWQHGDIPLPRKQAGMRVLVEFHRIYRSLDFLVDELDEAMEVD